jgi:hypothetical protein
MPMAPSSFVAVLLMSEMVLLTFFTSPSLTLKPTLLKNSAMVTTITSISCLCKSCVQPFTAAYIK